jgi:uncharacterized DUF497 family protein
LLAGFVVEKIDDRREYGEVRVVAFGEIQESEFACVYTRRGETYRIISLRRAKRREGDVYREAKAQRDTGA